MKVNCFNCGKEFDVYKSRTQNKKHIFCSKKCEGEFRKDDNNVICVICKKEFHVKQTRLKRLKNKKNICCSKKCSNKLKEKTYLGKNNHQFGLKGELNASFKNDYKIINGYILLRNISHPFSSKKGFVLSHRLIMEEYLRSFNPESEYLIEFNNQLFLSPNVIVHHKNQNKLDNRIKNLQIMDLSEHIILHNNLNLKNIIRDENGKFLKRRQNKKSSSMQLFKKHFQDAGLDVCSNENKTIKSKESSLINTGLFVTIPDYHVGLLWSRSGLSVKNKIEVGAGCIDASYRGEIKVHLLNLGNKDYIVKKGNKIAQLLTIPINIHNYKQVDILDDTDRSNNGFGSTGE